MTRTLSSSVLFSSSLRASFALCLSLMAPVAGAVVIIVNDASDTLHNSGGCANTGTGTCTLTDAITFANANAGPDEIQFLIVGTGVHTITSIPAINDPVTIDGYTQPGSGKNTNGPGLPDNAVLLIAIASSLSLEGGPHAVRGLIVPSLVAGNSVDPTHEHSITIEGNFVGTDSSGMNPTSLSIGIEVLQCVTATIGGSAAASRNVISRGMIVDGGLGLIRGNFIGINAAGTGALGNAAGTGVQISGLSVGDELACGGRLGMGSALIGGGNLTERNVISGNNLAVAVGFPGFGVPVDGVIQGNLIGTDVTGTIAVPNNRGVELNGVGGTVGGDLAGEGNVISGNLGQGVYVRSSSAPVVRGNFIGTDVSGTAPLGNGGTGLFIEGTPFGAAAPISDNVIAFNGHSDPVGGGIVITSDFLGTISGYPILGNSIFENTSNEAQPNRGLGIDLGGDGVSAPHSCAVTDAFENAPVLTSAGTDESGIHIQGSLVSPAGTTRHVEFFSSPACDPSGHGEGKRSLGAADIPIDGTCNGTIDVVLPVVVSLGQYVTATASGAVGASTPAWELNTSEFSACAPVARLDPLALQFFTVPPCRLVDTRGANGPYGGPAINANTFRDYVVAGRCGISATAKSISLNVTVTQSTAPGFLRLGPGGTTLSTTSTINYRKGQTRANNAITTTGVSGDIAVFCGQTTGKTHVIIDLNGYFE